MQTKLQQIRSSQPRVFKYSLDWRFLLPIADAGKIRVVLEEDVDFSQTLGQVGIPISNQSSFSDLKQTGRDATESLALPFGLSAHWVNAQQEDQIEFYRSVRRLICPNGYFLIGFENFWKPRSNALLKYYPSTPRRVAYQLNQAGFRSIKFFGALPNLSNPEYIFALNDQAIHFALQHRFRRKPTLLNILRVVSYAISWSRVSAFLPGYFAVAVV